MTTQVQQRSAIRIQILEYLAENPGSSRAEMLQAFDGAKEHTVSSTLGRLHRSGAIVKTVEKPGYEKTARWSLAKNSATKREIQAAERIIEHMRTLAPERRPVYLAEQIRKARNGTK